MKGFCPLKVFMPIMLHNQAVHSPVATPDKSGTELKENE